MRKLTKHGYYSISESLLNTNKPRKVKLVVKKTKKKKGYKVPKTPKVSGIGWGP